jgi:mxaK protein
MLCSVVGVAQFGGKTMEKQLANCAQILMRLFPWIVMLGLLSIVLVVWSGVKLYQVHVYHQHLKNKTLNQTTLFASHETPEAIFANAVRYGDQGETDKALRHYAKVVAMTSVDNPLHKSAYFNSGNLYLKVATDKLEKEGLPAWDVAGPLVALAKESYQKALRIHPEWSEAKYNYQLALRLSPTSHGMRGPQQYEDENIKQQEKPSGWPAMPGNPRGMP